MKCNDKWLRMKFELEQTIAKLADTLFQINAEILAHECECCNRSVEMEDSADERGRDIAV
jgi:hypothetical protein